MEQPQPDSGTPDPTSDAGLIRAVAERRDPEAFAELYARHEHAAYALARHMLRSSDGAEVAVQEAMLRVWRSASKFRYDKNARGWVLRIVAFECIRIQKARRAESERTEPLEQDAPESAGTASAEQASREELLDGLRRCLERLPEANRQLVSLYYLAGLTQEEIGQELALPQQTVSNRLRDALKFLRSELHRIGLAAALPLLGENALGAALAETYAPPAALKATVLGAVSHAGVDTAAQASRALSRKAAAPALLLPLVVLGVVATAGGAYLALGPDARTPEGESVPEEVSRAETSTASQEKAERAPLDRSWSFENGLPEEFKVSHGQWTPIDPAKHGGLRGLASPASIKNPVIMPLPVEVPARPFLVHLRTFFSPDQAMARPVGEDQGIINGGVNLYWFDETGATSLQTYFRKHTYKKFNLGKHFTYEADYYFIDKYIFRYHNGELQGVNIHERAYPTRWVVLNAFGFGVSQLSIRELKDGEIPAELRDPDAKAEEVRALVRARKDGWK
ncbi:MAG: sigma-70 family RNA polymerase sigma factor [Planctomycetes bacterium]|nr:sigma-70 family RNA polymerase sigma factor [Planctomycetota bacterium]